ncbi:MAG: hypothetical protein QXQ48_05950 [Nitrososphaerota archaeon]
MFKRFRSFFTMLGAAAAFLAMVLATLFIAGSPKPLVIYSAPTLRGLSDELAGMSEQPVDIQVLGSVFAANLIKAGKTPDLFLSVDSELKSGLNYRMEKPIGIYSLVFVCVKKYDSLNALRDAKIGIADPNQAPIGYRALAAIFLISENEGFNIVGEVEKNLHIRYVSNGHTVKILAKNISSSGRFYMRPNLDFVGSLLEAGVVDCIFAHTPFVIYRNLYKDYNVLELPEYARFEEDPPTRIIAVLSTVEIEVRRFEAIALSFTEAGDELLQKLDEIDVEKFGMKRVEK